MIEAREFQYSHPDDTTSEIVSCEILEKQLRRIYLIEGGRETVEKAQREALIRLDTFERSLIQKKEKLYPNCP